MDKDLINHYKSMTSVELLTEISNGRLGSQGSQNRDTANTLLKLKERQEEQEHNEKIIEYMQKNYRLNFWLSISTILIAFFTALLVLIGSYGQLQQEPPNTIQSQENLK